MAISSNENDGTVNGKMCTEKVNCDVENVDIIKADAKMDKEGFELYEKRHIIRGYVKTTDIAKLGTVCKLSTCEGDVFITVADDVYIMIGLRGEAYPIKKDDFEKTYNVIGGAYRKDFEYKPSINIKDTNEILDLLEYASSCETKGKSLVYAKKLNKHIKIITKWDYEKHMIGTPGDYICYRAEDEYDRFIVNKDMFDEIYKEADDNL